MMERLMKKIFSILIVLSMVLSVIPVVCADTSLDVELTNIEYFLKKGSKEVNLVALSNNMEVRVKLNNKTAGSVKIRVDGYKGGQKVSGYCNYLSDGAVSQNTENTTPVVVKLGNVKTNCDEIKVYAFSGSSEKLLAIFPYISLGIKLNGKELNQYSDDLDSYSANLDTPFPYFEYSRMSEKQGKLKVSENYKMPFEKTIKAYQIGKDEDHKIDDRTIHIKLSTTSPVPSHTYNKYLIFWGNKNNNADSNAYDKKSTIWADMSGKERNLSIGNESWANGGLRIPAKWDASELTVLPDKVKEAVNGGQFAISFTPASINVTSGANLSLFGSDNGNFRIFVKKDSGKIYFEWGNARFTEDMASVDIADAVGKENTITVENGTVKWYINELTNANTTSVYAQQILTTTEAEFDSSAEAIGSLRWYNGSWTPKTTKTYDVLAHNQVGKITLSEIKEGNVGSYTLSDLKFFDLRDSQSADSAEAKISQLTPNDTQQKWYDKVDKGIDVCGTTKTLVSGNVNLFCLSDDDLTDLNTAEIAGSVNAKLSGVSLKKDFDSYNKVAKLTQNTVIATKNKAGKEVKPSEVTSYINNTLPKEMAGLLDVISDSTVSNITNEVNRSVSANEGDFGKLLQDKLIIKSITEPKLVEPGNVANRINTYGSTIGIDSTTLLNFKNAPASVQAKIANIIVTQKPTTADGIESIISANLSGNDNSQQTSGATAGGDNTGGLSPMTSGGIITEVIEPTVTIAGFSDMAGSEWVGTALAYMVENGFVSGVANGKFAPKNNITRSEFVAIIARCEGLEDVLDADDVFDDVPKDFWGYNSIMAAYKNGIISGVGERSFNPSGNITRQDIAVILYNVYKLKATCETEDTNFADWGSVSEYAKEAVGKLHALKILNGYGSDFMPQGLCTRAEAVQAIYSYLQAVNQ